MRKRVVLVKKLSLFCMMLGLMGSVVASPSNSVGSNKTHSFPLNLKKGKTYSYDVQLKMISRNEDKSIPMFTLKMPTRLAVTDVKDGVTHAKLETTLGGRPATQKEILIDRWGKVSQKDKSVGTPLPALWPGKPVRVGDKWELDTARLGQLSQIMGYKDVSIICAFTGFQDVASKRYAKISLELKESSKEQPVGAGVLLIDPVDGMVHSLEVKCKDSGSLSKTSQKHAELYIKRLS